MSCSCWARKQQQGAPLRTLGSLHNWGPAQGALEGAVVRRRAEQKPWLRKPSRTEQRSVQRASLLVLLLLLTCAPAVPPLLPILLHLFCNICRHLLILDCHHRLCLLCLLASLCPP